jgi:hypothetical protein
VDLTGHRHTADRREAGAKPAVRLCGRSVHRAHRRDPGGADRREAGTSSAAHHRGRSVHRAHRRDPGGADRREVIYVSFFFD